MERQLQRLTVLEDYNWIMNANPSYDQLAKSVLNNIASNRIMQKIKKSRTPVIATHAETSTNVHYRSLKKQMLSNSTYQSAYAEALSRILQAMNPRAYLLEQPQKRNFRAKFEDATSKFDESVVALLDDNIH